MVEVRHRAVSKASVIEKVLGHLSSAESVRLVVGEYTATTTSYYFLLLPITSYYFLLLLASPARV